MRVFLSHSSVDKGFVEAVAENLRPGTFELDSLTFDAGLINSQAILKSLERCDLFCLFLSKSSVRSSYVDFEIMLSVEYMAKAKISQFLVFCLDDDAFNLASENAKFFNIVRKILSPESVSRTIQGQYISSSDEVSGQSHPFVGRETQLSELERQISDSDRPLVKAVYISGNAGSGRKTLARKFYGDQFPHVGKIFPRIEISSFAGQEELFRTILVSLRPSILGSELRRRIEAFAIAGNSERWRQISELINSLLPAREACIMLDLGGVLTDSGQFTSEIDELVSRLEARPHPPLVLISPRAMPKVARRQENDIAYSSVTALNWDAVKRLLSRLLKERGMAFTPDQLKNLVDISDCHPYNVYRIVDDVTQLGVSAFLANPRKFLDWKHRQSSEYLDKIEFSNNENLILGVLRVIPQLDFESISLACDVSAQDLEFSLDRLAGLHIIDAFENRFQIAPALRTAVERDIRSQLPKNRIQKAVKAIAESLNIRIEEGSAPFQLMDAAVLSSIESGALASEFVGGFILPSHHAWLSKHHYDNRNWEESIRYGKEAVKGRKRLSSNGFVAACRYVCLASARLNRSDIFDEAISELENNAKDDWARSNVSYLKGFRLRNKGNLPAAEELFKESYNFSPGNHSALRELAAISLARGNVSDAEAFAREALGHSPRNPYLIDVLLSVLMQKHGMSSVHNSEIEGLFEILERVGESEGRSFYTTRRAEFELITGDTGKALSFIMRAVAKTPMLFEPKRLYASILLRSGNKSKAFEVIESMKNIVMYNERFDRKFNYRSYLVSLSEYYSEVGRFVEAKELFNDPEVFTSIERERFVKSIEMAEAYRRRN